MKNWINHVHTDDCLKVLQKMPSKIVHLAITSPPYNLGINYDGYDDNMDYAAYKAWMAEIFLELQRVLVNGGRFALNVAPTGISPFHPIHIDLVNILRDQGYNLRAEIFWYKQTMRRRTAWGSWKSPSDPHVIPSWEYVYVFSNGASKLEGAKEDTDITKEEFKKFSNAFWAIRPETRKRQPFMKKKIYGKHPAPFPEELVYRLLKYYSFKGNVIMDFFGGTGTVAAVAVKTDRKFIHIEKSIEYNEIARQRIENAFMEKDDGGTIFS